MKKKLISEEDLSAATRVNPNSPLISLLAGISGVNKLNTFYDEVSQGEDESFIERFFELLDLKIEVSESDLARIPLTGSFITVSNHPFGAIDGMVLLKILSTVRPDYKVLANFLLQHVQPVKDRFIAVNPFENHKNIYSNLAGLKKVKTHLAEGSPLGIFPAGEVSTYQTEQGFIADKQWMLSALKIIQRANVPVIPVYFDGGNSYLFHLLGMVHPGLRTLRLPKEMLRKKGKTIKLRIGKPISPKELNEFSSTEQFGRFLRAKTYALGSSLEIRKEYFRTLKFPKKQQDIFPAPDTETLVKEIESINEYKLFHQDVFECYLAPARAIPNLLTEIGRLREITFREVGEGTNKSIDIDEYDLYYRHLILWDKEASKLVGAYRIGFGAEILEKFGKRGFYTSTLFKLKKGLLPILGQSLELGRSFILKEYQQKRLPLFLLWKGILFSLVNNPQYRYLFGPVSISNDYQQFSKDLIISFVMKYYYDGEMAAFVQPKHPYRFKEGKVDREALVDATESDLKKLDKVISDIEPQSWTIPVLLKKYLLQNAKIIGFNRDPKFNNALDGLIVLDLHNVPPETIANLRKEFEA